MGDGISRKRSGKEKAKKESHGSIQGEGCDGGAEGRQDAGGTGGEVRHRRQPDYAVEDAIAGGRYRRLPDAGRETRDGGAERKGHAGKDPPIGIGKRFFGRRARSHRQVIDVRSRDIHQLGLPADRQLVRGIDHFFALALPKPVSATDLAVIRRIDELHLNHPFAGARMLRDMLKLQGVEIGRKHVGTLMGKMGITEPAPEIRTWA